LKGFSPKFQSPTQPFIEFGFQEPWETVSVH